MSRDDIKRVLYDKPSGIIEYRGNNVGIDEAGRVYEVTSWQQKENRQRWARTQRDKRHFTFTDMTTTKKLADYLPNRLAGYILILHPYIEYNTGALIKQGRSPKPLNINGIAEALGVTRRTAKTAVSDLKKYDVIEEKEGEAFYMNDRYHFRGAVAADNSKDLIKTFHTTLKALQSSAKPAELGVLYKLLPYVHRQSNFICKNPNETDPTKVIMLSGKSIAGIVGMSPKKARETLDSLVNAGALAKVERRQAPLGFNNGDGRVTLYAVNTTLVSRLRNQAHAPEIVQMFEAQCE